MSKVLVSIKDPISQKEIDLSDPYWSSLDIDNLPLFNIVELKRVCAAYPDGIFPGAEEFNDYEQKFTIYKFKNLMEFCKVTSDEVIKFNDDLYLTTKFYEKRKEGWSSNEVKFKEGEVVGYCINGDVYSAEDHEQVENIFYETIYYSLVNSAKEFKELKDELNNGVELILTGKDEKFMKHLAMCLLKNK